HALRSLDSRQAGGTSQRNGAASCQGGSDLQPRQSQRGGLLAFDRACCKIPCVIPVSLPVRDVASILDAVDAFVREPNGGLVLPPDVTTIVNRDLIVALAARHRLPAVYSFRSDVMSGGLMSYGPDTADLFVRAASYVDRILKGEKP